MTTKIVVTSMSEGEYKTFTRKADKGDMLALPQATRRLVVVKGKGAKRIKTGVILYWAPTLKRWVSVPEGD